MKSCRCSFTNPPMQHNTYSVAFYTLGCRVNQYETRAVEEAFLAKGFTIGSFDEKCDVYVINTCTVTAESDRKSRQIIRRARKIGGENALVLAMGCMIEVDPEQAAAVHGLDLAIGNRDKTALADAAVKLIAERRGLAPEAVAAPTTAACTSNYMHVTGSDKVRAFVKIADGCENHCSYCIIPKARGKVRSKPENEVCEEIAALVKHGYKEIVLTGIETAAYGKDLPNSDLISLVEKVDKTEPAPARIRMGSLEPTVIKKDSAARLAACKHVCPHFHLSLQSGCDAVLAAMRRKYNTRMFTAVLDTLRADIPGVTFTTDIIVGFPGETEEMFQQTEEFVRKSRFLYVHIFPYSDRSGTEASKRTDKIDEAVKKDRAARLKAVMLDVRKDVLTAMLDSVHTVLIEKIENGTAVGHTENYIETHIAADAVPGIAENSLVPVTLTGFSDDLSYMDAVYAPPVKEDSFS